MTYIYTTDYGNNYGSSTFMPCCNAPLYVDAVYQPRYTQEVYYAAEPAPEIQVIRQRLPDPPPDVIERVVVVPQPKKYVYQVVEVPMKPPPVIRERVVHQSSNQPLCGGTYRVQVPSRSSSRVSRVSQSSSFIQPSNSYIQAPQSFIQPATSYVQAQQPFIQSSPSYVQSSFPYISNIPLTY